MSSMRLTWGMKICPSCVSDLCWISMRGSRPSWIACRVSEKAPVITAWLAMTVATVARTRAAAAPNAARAKRRGFRSRLRIGEHQRALAEIVERQRRQHEKKPGDLDRPATEMAHIGIERLGAGHRQKDRAEDEKADKPVIDEKGDTGQRIERAQNARRVGDVDRPEQSDDDEKDRHERAEEGRDFRRAVSLDGEDGNQHDDGERQDIVAEQRRADLQAFERRKHRNRRGDDRIAGEQRRAGDAEKEIGAARRPKADCASAISESVPPSPLLSARIRNSTYLAVTMKNKAQSSSETVPVTLCSLIPVELRCE